MAEAKTKKNKASVKAFLNKVNVQQREDCDVIVEMMRAATSCEPEMWGAAIIGFGSYHYVYATGREGDWMRIAVSPRKQNISIYIIDGLSKHETLLAKLGKHKIGKSCLYIKRLEDIDLKVLGRLIKQSIKNMNKLYPVSN